jgi:hypothetical protein
MEMGAGREDCFHMFFIGQTQSVQLNYLTLDRNTDYSKYESIPAPIARISNLQISLRDEFNSPMDLNQRELSLVFEITHLE